MDFKGFAFNGVQGQSPWPFYFLCLERVALELRDQQRDQA